MASRALPAPRTVRAPRKQRATRPMILDAARRIAGAEGWQAVTIRRVADALGYTSPLIYEHFVDKGDALAAILREGFDDLAAVLAAAAAGPLDPADPDAHAHAVAGAYLAFARRETAVYQLMNGTCEVAVEALQRWAVAAGVRLADPLQATEVLWCALHGVACLAIAGRLDVSQQAAGGGAADHHADADAHTDALLHEAVRALLAGWRTTDR